MVEGERGATSRAHLTAVANDPEPRTNNPSEILNRRAFEGFVRPSGRKATLLAERQGLNPLKGKAAKA